MKTTVKQIIELLNLNENESCFLKDYTKVYNFMNKIGNISIQTVNNIVLSNKYYVRGNPREDYRDVFLDNHKLHYESIINAFKLQSQLQIKEIVKKTTVKI